VTEIQPFTFPITGEGVRTLLVDETPWFVATDVCAVLGHTNASMAMAMVDDDDRWTIRRSDALSFAYPFDDLRIQAVNLVNESGLFSLILRSNVTGAREFKRWVTSEVLPSIRKTGSYSQPELSRKDLALMVIAAEEALERAENRAAMAEIQAADMAPAAYAWDTLASANGDFSVGDAAKILSRDKAIKTGQGRLFTTLYRLGWTYRQQGDGRWRVKQTAIDAGRLSELAGSHYHPRTGELILDAPQVRVTVKGVLALQKHLGGHDELPGLMPEELTAA
jgi:prophage antirepressor-like protein